MRPPEVDLLRRVAERHETEADRAELAHRVRHYLAGAEHGVNLDEAFGLACAPGQLPWWRIEALGRRNVALRALASYYPNRTTAEVAFEINRALRKYAASSWRFDREKSVPPAEYLGTPRECMFDALKASENIVGIRQLQRILSGQKF